MLLNHEKENFLHLPTPIEYLPRISEDLGIELYIKRDDLTPLAMGGNKLRKLEYLLRDAMDNKATMLLTVGGVKNQSRPSDLRCSQQIRSERRYRLHRQISWRAVSQSAAGRYHGF